LAGIELLIGLELHVILVEAANVGSPLPTPVLAHILVVADKPAKVFFLDPLVRLVGHQLGKRVGLITMGDVDIGRGLDLLCAGVWTRYNRVNGGSCFGR